jgi:creatinine amidohydrolase
MERQLQKLSWPRIRELVPAQIDTVILPVGTVEAHGSACIGTDNVVPETIAEGIADRVNALVAPTVNYGITKSLYRYEGGFTIETETFQAYIGDILLSLAKNDFKNIIIMNGHGGNNSALKQIAFEFHTEVHRNVAVIHWWELCGDLDKKFWGHPGGHAGTNEAALAQATDPNYLDEKAYDPDMAYWYRPGADVYPVPGTILLYEKGVGYPEFDEAKAREYRDAVVAEVGAFVEDVLRRWRKFGL